MSKFDPNFPERRSLGTVPEIVPAETSPVPAEAAAALEAAETALVETFEVIEDEAVPGAAKALSADAVVEDAPAAAKKPAAPAVVEGVLTDDESDADGADVDAEDDVEFGVSAAKTRIERWKARLLDLSLKNRLLNFDSGKALRIHDAGLDALEDALAPDADLRARLLRARDDPVCGHDL